MNKRDWNIGRFGSTLTELPDGRLVYIAGEYEDYYDPNFFIYNDVIIVDGDKIQIYGYPCESFPPTDFHTSILINNKIWIFGSLGYIQTATDRCIQVLCLDTETWVMTKIEPKGDPPGWIHFKGMLESPNVFKNYCRLHDDGHVYIQTETCKYQYNVSTNIFKRVD